VSNRVDDPGTYMISQDQRTRYPVAPSLDVTEATNLDSSFFVWNPRSPKSFSLSPLSCGHYTTYIQSSSRRVVCISKTVIVVWKPSQEKWYLEEREKSLSLSSYRWFSTTYASPSTKLWRHNFYIRDGLFGFLCRHREDEENWFWYKGCSGKLIPAERLWQRAW